MFWLATVFLNKVAELFFLLCFAGINQNENGQQILG